MRTIRAWLLRLRSSFGEQRQDGDLTHELESHLQFHIDDNLRAGMSPEEARRQALIKFGGVEQTKEAVRERRGLLLLDSLQQDVRFALRMLGKNPGFAATAILTLALGIGANTAIFNVANSVLFRPLPFEEPSRLVFISTDRTDTCCVSLPYLTQIQQTNRSFSDVAAYQYDSLNLARPDAAEQVDAERVTWNLFELLGAKPVAGRTFTAQEDLPGGDSSVLVGYKLALRLFGGAREALGQHLALDSRDYTVVGVLPPKFGLQLFGREPDVWMTRLTNLSMTTPARVNIGGSYYYAVGRLRPGVTAAPARVEMEVLFQQYKQAHPGNFDATSDVAITVDALRPDLDPNVRPTIRILSAAVGFLLLIACANVASLLLARALRRRREFAVRSALGSPRWAMVRLMLCESVLMAMVSGALGISFGYAGMRLLAALLQSNLPQVVAVSMDWRVLGFTLAISLLSGFVFGLAPALQLSRSDPAAILNEEGRGATGSRTHHRLSNLIVAAQVALPMVLLIGSGLLIRSLERLETVNPGFNPASLLTERTFLPVTTYSTPQDRIAFFRAALDRVQSIPGVVAAAFSTALPVLPNHATPARFEGQAAVELGQEPIVLIESISKDYAKTLGVPLLEGREFSDLDDAKTAPVVMVNAAMARKYWPHDNPIGKLVWVGALPAAKVIGVLGDDKNQSLAEDSSPEVFLPYPQFPSATLYLSVRSAVEPYSLVPAIRAQIFAINSGQPTSDVQTMNERLATSSAPQRSLTLLVAVFSAAALVLALVGIYGVIVYSVAQRKPEMGLRIALGASSVDILKLVVGAGLRLSAAGIVVGLAASFALTRLLTSVLYATSATDPLTFAVSVVLFIAVAALASYLPARRAMRVDPMVALRHQ